MLTPLPPPAISQHWRTPHFSSNLSLPLPCFFSSCATSWFHPSPSPSGGSNVPSSCQPRPHAHTHQAVQVQFMAQYTSLQALVHGSRLVCSTCIASVIGCIVCGFTELHVVIYGFLYGACWPDTPRQAMLSSANASCHKQSNQPEHGRSNSEN
jgi:hypothetical protein